MQNSRASLSNGRPTECRSILVFKDLILQTRVRTWGWEIIHQQNPCFRQTWTWWIQIII